MSGLYDMFVEPHADVANVWAWRFGVVCSPQFMPQDGHGELCGHSPVGWLPLHLSHWVSVAWCPSSDALKAPLYMLFPIPS